MSLRTKAPAPTRAPAAVTPLSIALAVHPHDKARLPRRGKRALTSSTFGRSVELRGLEPLTP